MANPSRTDLLRALPQVEEMLQLPEVSALLSLLPRSVLADCVREAVDETRRAVLAGACERVDVPALAESTRAPAVFSRSPYSAALGTRRWSAALVTDSLR